MLNEEYRNAARGSNPGTNGPQATAPASAGFNGARTRLGGIFSQAAEVAAVLLIFMAFGSALMQLGL